MRLPAIQRAVENERLDGWLFTNFRHRDQLADRVLEIPADAVNTRPWFYYVPSQGSPAAYVHTVESHILSHLPGTKEVYSDHEELKGLLSRLAGKRCAVHASSELPILSLLDHGTGALFEAAGIELHSAASLIQRTLGIVSPEGRQAHERAANALYDIIEETWHRLARAQRDRRPTELEVQRWMVESLTRRGLETDHPPIVAAGAHSADPHFAPEAGGPPIPELTVVQFDIWAKEPGGRYADISWIGYTGSEPPEPVLSLFRAVTSVRDEAVGHIADELASGHRPAGAAIDSFVRERIVSMGYGSGLRHRTGHGIDTECHGSGVNLDSVEFPDGRLLLDGSLFSVEPGIYLDTYGMRTEINVLIDDGVPEVTGPGTQSALLLT